MNLSEIKELVRKGLETAILNNEQASKSVFFELLSKVEQFEQKELISKYGREQKIVMEDNKIRTYTKIGEGLKIDGYKVANYLSLYSHEDLFPNFSQDRALEEIACTLNMKKNTIRNWRDMFDWHNRNNIKKENVRKGWVDCNLPQPMEEIKNEYGSMPKEEFLAEVKQILNID